MGCADRDGNSSPDESGLGRNHVRKSSPVVGKVMVAGCTGIRQLGGPSMSEPRIKAGQSWHCRGLSCAPALIVIGAVVEIAGRPAVACCSVTAAAGTAADGSGPSETVPFLPLTIEALADSVGELASEADGEVAAGFLAAFQAWQADPRGLSVFNVAYDGSLDRLIARQMASIVGVDPNSRA